MPGVRVRRGENAETQGRDVKTEAETGEMQPHAREWLEPPGAGRSRE